MQCRSSVLCYSLFVPKVKGKYKANRTKDKASKTDDISNDHK